MPPKRRFIKCEICGKRAYRQNDEKRPFMAKFPLDEGRCRQWVKFVGNEDLVYIPIEKLHTLKYICEDHFNNKAFNKKRSRLKKSAIPTTNLKADPLPDEMLLNFPCHIFSNIDIAMTHDHDPPAIHDNEDLLPQVKPLAGANKSEPLTSVQPHLLDHDYSKQNNTNLQSPERKKMSPSDVELTPRRRKLIKKIELYKRKISILREGNIMPRIKSLALKTLINAYIRNHDRSARGKRWTPLEKALAIAIYKKSPRTYRHLQRLMALPSIRTLQTLLQSIDLEPGINQTIMEHLKKKAAKLDEKDRLCALLFDEITLKKRLIYNSRTDKIAGFVDLGEKQCRSSEVANHAMVFMLQGLHKKFKQPIAYYFVKGTISSKNLAGIIKDIIKALADIRYEVVTTVCDQGPTNIGGVNLLKNWCGVPITSNYFKLDDKNIYIMFDIPHLLKSVRNNFCNGGEIVVNGKKGKWCHLLEVAEKNKSTLHFKKITELHVNPTYRSKMKVKLAAQVLSNTVAAILKLMAEKYGDVVKAQEILETAQIVEDLDKLFDCTNGPSSKKDIIKNRRENVSKKTNHVELWRHYQKVMKTMHFLKSDSSLRLKNVRCVQGYITSLSSLEDIWKYVESKGFRYLNLRQLNQDSLENLFGMIRQHCPTNRNPTCHHFTAALKSNILTKLSTPVGRGANCEDDDNEAVIEFEDFFQSVKKTEKTLMPSKAAESPMLYLSENTVEVPVLHLSEQTGVPQTNCSSHDDFDFADDDAEFLQIENSIFESFDKQPTVYVAGYLASVVLKKIRWQCEHCKHSLKTDNYEECDTTMYSYIKLREWWPDKKSLTYPTTNLCMLVDTATLCFEDQVKPILHELNICQQAVTMMLTKCDNLLWVCSVHKDHLLQVLLVRLSQLLIRNECHRLNLAFAKFEEPTADFNKKSQHQGTAK